jgi:AbrB family looped-hinge helix DNA binding protein
MSHESSRVILCGDENIVPTTFAHLLALRPSLAVAVAASLDMLQVPQSLLGSAAQKDGGGRQSRGCGTMTGMAAKGQTMPKVHIRGDKLTVTIPARLREKIAVHDGDEIEVSAEAGRIVLTPKEEMAERHPEIDAAIAEGLAEVRAGRLSPKFSSMEEFKAWRKTAEGKKFRTA